MTEDRLSQALAAWADANRPSERDRERMRTAILLTPQVDELWWERFGRQMERIAARAARPRVSEPRTREWAAALPV